MSMTVKNNLSAVRALNQVNENNSELQRRLQKVSSGMKINSAGDDASGYSISERMRVQLRSLNQDYQNVQNGSAMLRTASGGVEDIVNLLRTMKEKAINAANDSNTDEDRQTIQKELTQLIDTINDVALGNEYNGKRLLDGRYDPKTKYKDAATTAVEVAKGMMTSLNNSTSSAATALDEAIKAASNGKFSTTDSLVQSFLRDLDAAAPTDTTSARKFLEDYCDIILLNDDTGAITGSDAGGDTTKTASSVVPEQVAVTSWGLPTLGGSTTIDGLTINWPTTGASGSTLTDKEEHILKGLNSDWIEQSLNLVKESYGIDFNDEGATVKSINVTFENDSTNNRLAAVSHMYNPATGNATSLTLIVNMHYYNTIDTASPDGANTNPSLGAGYLDRTIAHEFTHAVMAANIKNFSSLPKYFKEGTAELVHGIDDIRTDRINQLLTTRKNDLEDILNGTIEGDDGDPYAAGYMLLRYLSKQGQALTGGRIGENTRFNPLVIQHGTQAGQHMNLFIKDMQTKSLTAGDIFNSKDELINESDKARYQALNYDPDKQAQWLETLRAAAGMTIDDISVKTKEDANIAIRVLDGALEYSLDNATTIGAYLQRLDFTATNITTSAENVQAAESTIRDADMAKEMMNYTKANVLLQAAQSMLAQANQSPENVLGLLQ